MCRQPVSGVAPQRGWLMVLSHTGVSIGWFGEGHAYDSTGARSAGRSCDLRFEGREAKTLAYLERMEAGTLDPTGVSRRVLEALGRILGADPGELEAAGTFGGFSRPAFAAFRSDAPPEELARRLEVVADALAAESPEGFDEVDRLFRGGRDAGAEGP